ncbi:hypothetical protein [Candidatus Electronema sp. JM]|uniref:hypothetical protein n=1 Tax=Candidatus Electronema sp. JM TaxID=3401571 RepID=UPI003AA7D9AA
MRGEIEDGGGMDCGRPVLAERRGFCRQLFGFPKQNLVAEVYFLDKIIEAVNDFIESLDELEVTQFDCQPIDFMQWENYAT